MDFYDMKIFFISFSIQKFQKCSKWKAEMNFTINQLGTFFTLTDNKFCTCKAKRRRNEGVLSYATFLDLTNLGSKSPNST